ncbi:MAG: hypothetical protein JST00_43740 [Deltaproteobacteria bacterium]|nr:hypothetical protein [Deltaproteobacteria bacterium]
MLRFPGSYVALALATGASVGAALGGVACSGTSSTETVTPITSIAVRAESVIAGKGCGRGAGQVFKYAVLVGKLDPTTPTAFRNENKLAANVYDCFTDGTFVDLPTTDNTGYGEFAVLVYAFNEAAWRAAGGDGPVLQATDDANTFVQKTNPTWSTKCDAAQQPLVQTIARCNPLAPSKAAASVSLGLGSFPSAAGPLTCDKDYTKVVYRFSIDGGAPGATSESPCSRAGSTAAEPVTIQISPATAPATYRFEVAPIRADGTAVGQTTCTATASPGLGSSAECAPLK